jgi:hypothetical protein
MAWIVGQRAEAKPKPKETSKHNKQKKKTKSFAVITVREQLIM